MPEVSRFYGIVIKVYFGDHNPPHFHAEYGEFEVVIGIESLAVIGGALPPRAMGLVTEWGSVRQPELAAAWERASKLEPPGRIAPLS
ncbi:MAG: DUF4160 domain-containing protein [Longimicrobiales bacterium]|nr:DUF4160 domain-containing protein [Longimicrobiales bacterium]